MRERREERRGVWWTRERRGRTLLVWDLFSLGGLKLLVYEV
jgi:hypothetical protein